MGFDDWKFSQSLVNKLFRIFTKMAATCQEGAHMQISADQAETIALKALAWVSGNDELFPVFMGATGASLDDLKSRAADPEFLGSVLDFLMMDDGWVIEFCDSAGLKYESPMQARMALPGGAQIHWT